MEKKEAALVLFLEGYSQVDIARLLKVSEQTLSKWVADGDWKGKRAGADLFEKTAVEHVQDLILYQLEVMRTQTRRLKKQAKYVRLGDGGWEEVPDNQINVDTDELNLEPISADGIVALKNLFAQVKKRELSWHECVRIIRRFLDWIQERDLELAKRCLEHADDYLNTLRKQMTQ